MAKKRPSKQAPSKQATTTAPAPLSLAPAIGSRPRRLTGANVVLVNGNNGCFLRGETVYYYIDPPDPGEGCYYFAAVFNDMPGPPAFIRHVQTDAVVETAERLAEYRTFELNLPVEPVAESNGLDVVNICKFYLLAVYRICYGGATEYIDSVSFRVCNTCP